jgi:hypothetical protein
MNMSICEDFCPTGYTTGALVCNLVAANPFILHLTGFNTFRSTFTDSQNNLIALLGDSVNGLPLPDDFDPIM